MGGLSPKIGLIKYDRGKDEDRPVVEEYEIDGLDLDGVMDHPKCQVLEQGWVLVLSSPCDIYLNHTAAHVREGVYDRLNMMIIREHVVDTVSNLNEEGVIDDLTKIR